MLKILIVDDEVKSCTSIASMVQRIIAGEALVETESDANEAIQKALKIRPDLAILDIEMPVKSGLEVAKILHSQLADMKIIFLTAYDRFDYAVGALRSGAAEYLLKPIGEQELREVLSGIIDVPAEEKPKDMSNFEVTLNVWCAEHFAQDLPLEEAAAFMGMSPFYFSHQIKMETGKTFLEFITAYRIEKAQRLLSNTELTISEVGRSIGYPDANYFSKVFKRVAGITPSVFRSRLQEQESECDN